MVDSSKELVRRLAVAGNDNRTQNGSGCHPIIAPDSKTITAGSSDIGGQHFIGGTGYNISGRIASSSGTPESKLVEVQGTDAAGKNFIGIPRKH